MLSESDIPTPVAASSEKPKETSVAAFLGPALTNVVPSIRVLVVADGDLNFGATVDDGFGLGKMVADTFTKIGTPWDQFEVITAHRGNQTAQIGGFKFNKIPDPPFDRPFDIDHYEEVWLFGMDTQQALSPEELKVLTKFMEDGGGVFATGDHDDLGVAMCGEVPRVRSMRVWQGSEAPPVIGPTRIDTRRVTGSGLVKANEGDGVPQIIRPTLRGAFGSTLIPHFLLGREDDKIIRVLPDHMHEGICTSPGSVDLEKPLLFNDPTTGKEYPAGNGGKPRPISEIVAFSTTPSWLFPFEPEALDVFPRPFISISAYDGQVVNRGRVAVDSSFHHFTNFNLRGFVDASGKPTDDYEAIKRYFRNIAVWLIPATKSLRRYVCVLVALSYTYPLTEEIRPVEDSDRDFFILGRLTRCAISRSLSAAAATEFVSLMARKLEKQAVLEEVINPQLGRLDRSGLASHLLNGTVIAEAILGAAMLAVVTRLPKDSNQLDGVLPDIEALETALLTNVGGVMDSLVIVVNAAGDTLKSMSTALST